MAIQMYQLVLLVSLIGLIGAANILVLSPYTAPSHSNFFLPIVKELAGRGHSITYWNGLEPRAEMANVRQLYSENLRALNADHQIGFDSNNPVALLLTFPSRMNAICTAVFNDTVFQDLMMSTRRTQYDLIIVESVFNECMLTLVHQFQCPFVYLNSLLPAPWHLNSIGSPMSFDRYPVLATPFTDRMDLVQRTINTAIGLLLVSYRNWVILPSIDRTIASFLGADLPPVKEIESNVSLLITNTHMSLNYQFPKINAVVEAGCLHCVAGKPLSGELEEFVSGSGDAGFIYLSFGSILRGADLPEATRRVIIKTFSRLAQRVLWKFEEPAVDLPSNVRVYPWLPQQDLLAHANIKLFITHGGLFSFFEAAYHGVPTIGMPVFADQFNNVVKAERDGYAIHLDWNTVTEQVLFEAIQQMLTNPGYKQRIQHVSALMRDQPETALDRAVYWIEYVVRHRGAPHLRSHDTPLYQQGLLDVMAIFILLLLLLVYSIYSFIRYAVGQLVYVANSCYPPIKKEKLM